jgi:dienelactone hydrolase
MKKWTKVAIWLCAAWAVLARAAPPLEVYGALPGVDQIRLSPSGEQYALFGVIDGSRKFAAFSFEGKPLFVMDMGTIKVRDLQWAGENHVLLTVSSTFKGPLVFTENVEIDNVLNVNIAKRTARPIFYGHNQLPGAVLGQYGIREVGGHLFGYFGAITLERGGYGGFQLSNANEDLYRIDLDSGDALRLVQGSELRRNWVMATDGSLMAHSEYNEHDGVWKLYVGPGAGRMVIQRLTPLHSIGLIGLGRGPGTVLVEDNTGIQDVVEEVSIADGKVEPLFAEVTTEAYLHDRSTQQLIGAIVREEPKAQFFDQALLARFKATRKAFRGFTVSMISYSQGLQRMVVKTEGGDDSGTYWTVDIASGKASPVGYPYPAIRPADVGESRAFHYAASDGLDIEAILTLPPGKQATGLPLVVLPHGGPIRVSDEVGFDWWAQAYASRGYAVIQPNYRGSSGYGRAFVEAAFGQWGRKMQTDLSEGVTQLAKDGVIDPKRVCIVGASYGGYAALAGVTLQQGIYRCAVSVAGPADLKAFFNWEGRRNGFDTEATRFWRALIVADAGGDGVMSVLSPTSAAARADAPIMLIHGKDDTVVPIEQSELMESALKRAGKPHEMIVLNGEDHWLSREETRKVMLRAAVEFVEKYNPAKVN